MHFNEIGETRVGGLNYVWQYQQPASWLQYVAVYQTNLDASGLCKFIASCVLKHNTKYVIYSTICSNEVIKAKVAFCSVCVYLESLLYGPLSYA